MFDLRTISVWWSVKFQYDEQLEKLEFVGEINGDTCEENKRLPLALFNDVENRVVHLWRWIRYDSSA